MTHPEPRPAGQPAGHGGPIGPGRRRVHPLTPLLAGARALAAIAAVIAFNVVQQASFAGELVELATDSGPLLRLSVTGISLLVLAITAVMSWVSWRHRFFELADEEVRIGSGWLIRSRRTARFDRVQAVDVNQPLLARLVGLGEVKVETAGGDHSDLTIRFLPLDDCRAVRAAVLEAKRDTAGDAPAGIHAADHDPLGSGDWGAARGPGPGSGSGSATILHGPVPPPRLFGSAVIGPGLLLLAFPVVFVGAAFAAAATTAFGLGGGVTVGEAVALAIGAVAGTSFIGVAVFVAGIVASAWQRWNRFHGFTLSADDAAGRLHISAGLTSTRRQTIPVRRIHAMQIVEPAWWRSLHWATVRINVAGYAGEGSDVSTTLLPVAPLAEADAVVDGLIGRITGQRHQPSEARLASPRRAVWLSPIDWRNQTVRITPRALVVTSGRLRRRRAVLPWSRIQGRTLRQGPLSRALSLVDVRIDLVGGPVSVTAAQLAPDDAARLVRVLDERRGA